MIEDDCRGRLAVQVWLTCRDGWMVMKKNTLWRRVRLAIGARLWLVAFVGLAAVACVEDDPGDRPPELGALELTPERLAVGEPVEVVARFEFVDRDRDIRSVRAFIRTPRGVLTQTAEGELNTTAHGGGTARVAVALTPPEPGTYTLHVFVIDSRGNESNIVTGELEVVPPHEL